MAPRFLTPSDVLFIHEDLIREFGGKGGVRDAGLLSAALAAPEGGSRGRYFHAFPFQMAAAYAFHLVKNHPFVDGNKRVALSVALTFLEINGFRVMGGEDDLEAAMWAAASGKIGKGELATLFERVYTENRPAQ